MDGRVEPRVSDLPEPEQIRAAQRGDRAAYDCLVRRYQRQVYRWAYHIVRTHEQADEIAQDVFVRTYEALSRIDPDRPLAAWLCRTTLNLALNFLQKQQFRTRWQKTNAPDLSDFERDSSEPDALLRRRRVMQRIDAAINVLPPMYRTILLLRVKDELSYEEIASALSVSKGTVMSRLARARKQLKKSLGHLLDDLRP